MVYREHLDLQGQHALLSPSGYHWINYDKEKLVDIYTNRQNIEMGTRLHAFAAECIALGQRLPKSTKTLNAYVNDAIGFGMQPELVLYANPYCFGTADALIFDEKKNTLRIHDLKTGSVKAHMEQLYIYCALFCIEYGIEPSSISDICTRIYQFDDIWEEHPTSEDIVPIVNKIYEFGEVLNSMQ